MGVRRTKGLITSTCDLLWCAVVTVTRAQHLTLPHLDGWLCGSE